MITFYSIIFLLGTMAGFITGLLGIGGGILIIPAFLFILPLLGFDTIPMNKITGIAATQGMLGSIFAFFSLKKNNKINKDVLLKLLIMVAVSSLCGAVVSNFVNEKILLFILLTYTTLLVTFTIFFMVDNKPDLKAGVKITALPPILITVIGFMAGILGLGGAVLYIPMLNYFYRMDIKQSIANVTLLVFMTTGFAFIGKALTNQVPFEIIPPILLGAITGSKLGAKVNSKVPPMVLKVLLLIIVILTLIRVIFSLMQ